MWKGVCRCTELERGKVEKENMLQGSTADKRVVVGRRRERLLENNSPRLHCCRFSALSGPSCSLEAFSKGRLGGKERSRLPALSQEKQCGGWQGSYGKPFPLRCSCYLAGFHSVKKTHLQLVGQNDFIQ